MSAVSDRLNSLDAVIAAARDEHANEVKALSDQLLAAQLELRLTQGTLTAALAERDRYMRLATKFVTQFGTVEKIFSDVKNEVLAQQAEEERQRKDDEQDAGNANALASDDTVDGRIQLQPPGPAPGQPGYMPPRATPVPDNAGYLDTPRGT